MIGLATLRGSTNARPSDCDGRRWAGRDDPTVLVGILVNNSVNKAGLEGLKSDIRRVEESLRSDIRRVEESLRSDIRRVEDTLRSDIQHGDDGLKSELQRVEGVLTAKIDGLSTRVKALEDQGRATLVKG